MLPSHASVLKKRSGFGFALTSVMIPLVMMEIASAQTVIYHDGRTVATEEYRRSNQSAQPPHLEHLHRSGSIQDSEIENATLVRPVIIDSTIEDSTLIAPVIVSPRRHRTRSVIIQERHETGQVDFEPTGRGQTERGQSNPACLSFEAMRLACRR